MIDEEDGGEEEEEEDDARFKIYDTVLMIDYYSYYCNDSFLIAAEMKISRMVCLFITRFYKTNSHGSIKQSF